MSAAVLTVVQARTGSTRLPDKVLRPVAGRPVLAWQLDRMHRSERAGLIVVATTTLPGDDLIAELCRSEGIACVRGHPTDLLDRHLQAARRFGAEVVVKVPSDCPLVDPSVMDHVIDRFLAGGVDYAGNLHPPSWPDGQDVEAVSRDALEIAGAEAELDFEREHTTPFIWERPHRFRLANVAYHRDLSRVYRLTLDYAADLELIERLTSGCGWDASIDDYVAHLDDHPELVAINAAYRGVNWYRHHLGDLRTVGTADTAFAPDEVAV